MSYGKYVGVCVLNKIAVYQLSTTSMKFSFSFHKTLHLICDIVLHIVKHKLVLECIVNIITG